MGNMRIIEILLIMIIVLLVLLFLYVFYWRKREDALEKTIIFQVHSEKIQDKIQEQSIEQRRISARLISLKTGKTEQIDKERWYIGKNKANDYVIFDNPAVSRRHACIRCEKNDYYIEDLNSLNGTFVNGNEVNGKEKIKLSDRDKIVIADEVFEFQEYQI